MRILPSSILNTETLSNFQQVPVQNLTGRKRRPFSAIDNEIMRRKDLTPSTKLVWGVLRGEENRRDVIAISDSAIAEKCGLSRSQVIISLRQLTARELIKKSGSPVKQVQPYTIVLSAYGSPAKRDLSAAVADIPKITLCLRCQAHCKQASNKTGWCRTCVKDSAMEQQYRGAKLKLGTTATHDEIVKYLEGERDLRNWGRIARKVERAA